MFSPGRSGSKSNGYNSGVSDACVVLFAKPPRPGRVKTRLIGDRITAERAAELYAAFLRDMIDRFSPASDFDLLVAWALDEGEMPPEIGVDSLRQEGSDLGERMCHALRHAARDHAYVAALGSDHPDLPRRRVVDALNLLRAGESEAVLGPSRDGGYYLIALPAHAVSEELFEGIDWSTERVLHQTLSRCRAAGLATEMLEVESDIDRIEDLVELRRRLDEGVASAGETLAVLRSWSDTEVHP